MQVGALFGRYRLNRLLSADVMGEVWAAYDTSDRRTVVLRALPAEAADDFDYRDRFERDAAIAARLDDPHVVPVQDYGQIGNRLYRVSPLVDGANLWQELDSTGPLPPQRAVDVITEMATALQAVQAAGLARQEIASSNVIVRDDGRVMLAEVGLPTNAGNASGVYGLTAVLYECLTGKAFPWSDREPPRPSTVVSAVPTGLDAVIARGTAIAPTQRYRTVSELISAASAAAAGSRPATAAPPPSRVPDGWNRKVLIGAAAAIAVIVVAVVSGMLIGSGSSSEVAKVVTSSERSTAPSTQVTSKAAATSAPKSQGATETEPEAAPVEEPTQEPAQEPEAVDTGQALPAQSAAPAAPAPPPAPPPPPAPGVFPCDPGYVHTPPPDGPCWAPDSPLPPGQAAPAPAPAPAAPAPAAPEILSCYPGYVHTPPPDGPCWAPG
ncbi:serine/threonine protein kinase [Aldersonia sp. NBC_00410]|uniref:serine/threonine-protein kinase n=1 Tax=Aldersonia sp. NBC_00410 TaxID=2975954 RepID=UPI002253E2D8|nr:serine/threonine-protein kinase [Aldersonia sp. NBC_00410]MCX5045341.1 serine/threonine protein kinase [Aldersonia sp. NBC_00410]